MTTVDNAAERDTVEHYLNIVERYCDDALVDIFWKCVASEQRLAADGWVDPDVVAVRRWVEWCIGQRLNDPDSFLHRQLTPGVRAQCWALAALDGDVLHDHLRRTRDVAQLTRRHLHAHIDRAVRP